MTDNRHSQTHARLQEILKRKRAQLTARKREIPVEGVRAQARLQLRAKDLAMVLKDGRLSLVAEVKRASANGDLLVEDYDPVELAKVFEVSGAEVVSVATDEALLHGGLPDLVAVKKEVGIPVLRQDFIFDEYQVIEARAAGADGVRLIVGILNDDEMRHLLTLTQRMRMTALVEVHTRQELDRVLPLDPRLIGINHRDWDTDDVDLERTAQLRDAVPPHIAVISAGGIRTIQQVRRLAELKVDAFVVGEAVLTAPDMRAKISELTAI
jgi:indole-3-glycerol phosphate synthase